MSREFVKSLLVFLLIIVGFALLLLIPREMKIVHLGGLSYTSEYPFTFELFVENCKSFIQYFQTEKGFGLNRYGVPIVEEVKKNLIRDLYIIIPAFTLSMFIGTILGVIQFYFREKLVGRVQSFISWFLSSVPDFFFFIAIQYALIKLFNAGVMPRISLYGNDHWYNFIIPMIAITLFPLIHMVKFTAASLENEVGQDYLRTARSKGLQTFSVLKHMIWNCLFSIFNQTQFIMLYILTSLPIIEKLSSYQGAGYNLLDSIKGNDDVRAFAYMIPFLFFMFVTIIFTKIVKQWLVPQKQGDLR